MADYLNKTELYKNLPDQIILPPGVTWEQVNADRENWETNYKTQCIKIDDVVIYNTTFFRQYTYTELKAKVNGDTIKWSDIKYIDGEIGYTLYLLTADADV